MEHVKSPTVSPLPDSQKAVLVEHLDAVAQVHELHAKLARINKKLLEVGITRPSAVSSLVVSACW